MILTLLADVKGQVIFLDLGIQGGYMTFSGCGTAETEPGSLNPALLLVLWVFRYVIVIC